MMRLVEVRGRVPVHGRVTTPNVPAREALAEVNPVGAELEALVAAVSWTGDGMDPDLARMLARRR
jgi:hypothetical protein